jgi:hypothetical protein
MFPSGFGRNAADRTLSKLSTIGIANRPNGSTITVAKATPLPAPNIDVPAKRVPHIAESGVPNLRYTFTCLVQNTIIKERPHIDISSASDGPLLEIAVAATINTQLTSMRPPPMPGISSSSWKSIGKNPTHSVLRINIVAKLGRYVNSPSGRPMNVIRGPRMATPSPIAR